MTATTSRQLVATFTSAGLAAVARADQAGLRAEVTHIAIGRGATTGGYDPIRAMTALYAEFARRPISEAQDIAANEVSLAAVFEAGGTDPLQEGWIYEVGFYLADGTLLCVWSEQTGGPLTYRSNTTTLVVSLSLLFDAIPRDMLTFVVVGPSLSILNLSPTVVMATGNLRVINELTSSKVDQHTVSITALPKH